MKPLPETLDRCPAMPAWVTAGRVDTIEDMAFLSGAALATLRLTMDWPGVPLALWRDRLALRAARVCVGFAGRRETEAELRDAVHLARAGDLPGPAGAVLVRWRHAAGRKLSVPTLRRALPQEMADHVPVWLDTGPHGGPVGQAARVLQTVLAAYPRAEDSGLIIADAVLARAMGWDHLVPLLAAGLKSADLRKTDDDLRRACHRAVVSQSTEAVRLAQDLSRRAAKLQQVAPLLRAKGAAAAVDRFLTTDALTPSLSLTDLMSDRAARRLCDRLVALGAVRELTGRTAFRLYGV